MFAGIIILVPGLWLRGIAAGHVRKNAELTTTGPYAYTRNPLYFGSIVIALGFGVASRNWWVAAVILLLFAAIYLPVIKREEVYLRNAFPEFSDYAERVPRLVPLTQGRPLPGEGGRFSRELYMKHREYNALTGSFFMMVALALKAWWHF